MNHGQTRAIEQYISAYNRFDIAGMLQELHPDILFENISNGQVTLTTQGIEAFQQQAEQAKTFFHRRQQTMTDLHFAKPDTMVAIIDYSGVLAVPLPNGMRPGETLNIKGKSTFVFRDGKIVGIRDES